MINYDSSFITPVEIPDEISIAFTITGCTQGCPECHSKELWNKTGHPLTFSSIVAEMENMKYISCFLLMGGENDFDYVKSVFAFVKNNYNIATAMYTGLTLEKVDTQIVESIDYLKVGAYNPLLGGLDSPLTNQRLYYHKEDITYKFWK